jgi:hypothetical protein
VIRRRLVNRTAIFCVDADGIEMPGHGVQGKYKLLKSVCRNWIRSERREFLDDGLSRFVKQIDIKLRSSLDTANREDGHLDNSISSVERKRVANQSDIIIQ